jgi:putative membrane protein
LQSSQTARATKLKDLLKESQIRMRVKSTVLLLLCFLLTAAAYAQCPAQGSLSFPVTLSGSQFGGQGSATGFGTGFVTINPNNNTATVQLSTTGLGPNVTSAGLFNNGTSFLPFFDANNTNTSNNNNNNANGNTGTFDQNGNFTNTVTLTQSQMSALLANPGAFSFGVSTGEFPNGAVTGTLMNSRSYGGTFSGTNLVGTNGATNAGGGFTANITPNANGSGSTLTYSFTPTGIGNNFTGLSLNQGGVGSNGSQFVNLASTGGTLTNGRYTGSVQLTNAQAQALMTNPSGYYLTANTSQFPNGAVRAQFGAAQYETWFPVAGSVRGAFGNQWMTDIRIYNDGSGVAPATVTMELFPAGQTNTTSVGTMNAMGSTTLNVNSRATNALTNVTQMLASNFNGLGALRITSDQPIIAVERIYDANANGNGNNASIAAQPIIGRTMCDAVARGVLVGITSAVANGSTLGVRTNVGFFNPNPAPVSVQLNLGSSLGTSIGSQQSILLQPYQLIQLPLTGTPGNGFFNLNADVSDAALTFQSSAPIFAYTSNTNNTSGDTHVTFARPDMSVPATAQPDVAAIVMAANQGEIAEGQVAVSRASSATVRQFGQQMITDHSAAITQMQSVLGNAGITASTTSPTAQFLQAQTQQELTQLNSLSGAQFDRTYMQAQVNDHQKVLQMLDTMLIPSASATPSLVTLLQQMRGTVAQHLASAQSILSQLP